MQAKLAAHAGRLGMLMAIAAACGDGGSGPRHPVVERVIVSPATRTLVVGESVELGATPLDASGAVLAGRAVTWSSSDTLSATVTSAGLVHARGAGQATITASAEGRSGRALIEITGAAATPVARVRIWQVGLTLPIGETGQLIAVPLDSEGTQLRDRLVLWSSADAAVATVDADGYVLGRSAGDTHITATIEGRSESVPVTVTAVMPAGVDRVELDVRELIVDEGSVRVLTATPRDAAGHAIDSLGVLWTSSDPTVALVDQAGRVTALRPGDATVGARVQDRSASIPVHVGSVLPFDLVHDAWSGVPGAGTQLFRLDPREPAGIGSRIRLAGADNVGDAAVSPDGATLAFVVHDGAASSIHVVNRDGSGERRLTVGPADDQPAWSPDGERIAFRRRVNGVADIWVMAANGTALANLTADEPGTKSRPAWSRRASVSGYRIAYSLSSGGASHVHTMRDDGSEKRQITSGAFYDEEPVWSPDASTIAFVRAGAGIFGDLYLVDAAGGNERPLLRRGVTLAGPQWAPAWSPDGELIAFVSKHESYGTGNGTYQIYTVWADGTRLARRTWDASEKQNPAWMRR